MCGQDVRAPKAGEFNALPMNPVPPVIKYICFPLGVLAQELYHLEQAGDPLLLWQLKGVIRSMRNIKNMSDLRIII